MPDNVTPEEKPPNTRKYEVGTALDYSRVFRAWDDTVMELESGPSIKELKTMFRTDPQARQLFTSLKLPIRKAPWDILAAEGDKGEKDFVEWALNAPARQGGMTTPMRDVISKMANAIAFRFIPFEKVWKIADRGPYVNKAVLHKLGYRPPATCTLRTDRNGSFNGFVQQVYKDNSFKKVTFDPRRSLVYIHGADEEPIVGTTPFDTVYLSHKSKLKVLFFYFAFLENVAFPRTMVRVANEDPDALEYLLNKARQLSTQGIIGLYEDETIESYESARTTRDYQTALEYLDWQMAKACLGQFLDLGTSGERGSYALSQDKTNFFYESLDAVLQDIAMTINNYLIADLVQYNFGRDAAYPIFKFRPLNETKAAPILEMYRNVVMANSPNVTPPFLLALMHKVEEILDLEVDPLHEYDHEELDLIMSTIPTAREHLLSKESRAGAGQNPVTGEDKNSNNLTPQNEERLRAGGSLVKVTSPSAPATPGMSAEERRKEREARRKREEKK